MNFIQFHLIFNSFSEMINSVLLILICGAVLYGLGELAKFILNKCGVKTEGNIWVDLMPLYDFIVASCVAWICTDNFTDGILNGALISVLAVYFHNFIKMIIRIFKR